MVIISPLIVLPHIAKSLGRLKADSVWPRIFKELFARGLVIT